MTLAGCFRALIALLVLKIFLTIACVPTAPLEALADPGATLAGSALGELQSKPAPFMPAQRAANEITQKARILAHLLRRRFESASDVAIPALACIIAAAIDGLAIRRRRDFTFAPTSTVVYNTACYSMVFAFMAPLLYLAAPIEPTPWALTGFAFAIILAVDIPRPPPRTAPTVGLRI